MAIRPLTRLTLPLLAVALLGASAPAQGRVVLLTKERKQVPQANVTVISETLETVKFSSKTGGETTRKTADVVEIEYGAGSETWEKARRALDAGDLLNAETLFGAASRETDPPWMPAHALLKQAEAAARRGKEGVVAARGAIDEFLQRFPDHRLLPQVRLDQARYSTLAGDSAACRAALDSVITLVKDNKVTPDWAVRAHLADGDARLAAGDVTGATRAFTDASAALAAIPKDKLTDRPDLVPVVAQLGLAARVGSGSCLLESNDIGGARSFYERLARDGKDDSAVQAAAANGLAECDFREPGKLKAAQLGFARVALTAPGVPAERARAVYFLGRCAETLGAANQEPDGHAKALACFEEVVNRYPDTRWARLARESLP